MLKLYIRNNPDSYDAYLTKFLIGQKAYPQQSFAYFNFYKKTEANAWIITVENAIFSGKKENSILIYCLLIKHQKKIIRNFSIGYSYTILGPIIKSSATLDSVATAWEFFVDNLKNLGDEERNLFVKFYPPEQTRNLHEKNDLIRRNFWANPEVKHTLQASSGKHIPNETAIINLKKYHGLNEILKEMKPKWRYNIRLAEKKGVKISFSRSLRYFRYFWALLKITAKRQKFKYWSKQVYRSYIISMLKNQIGEWAIATYDQKILAVYFILQFGKIAIYHSGASSDDYRNVMPNHLLQFKIIERLKAQDYHYYDLWGVSSNPKNPLYGGISDFKLGFFDKNRTNLDKIHRWESAKIIKLNHPLFWLAKIISNKT
jgi:lipid II:glycine glycyltransferase (peptidoglycan interpeptide bridge formation enzyme)